MSKFVYAEDSLKHIECSIIAFNGNSPIEHFDDDNSFLMAWRARSLKRKKFLTVTAFEAKFKQDKDFFYRITSKLRLNKSQGKPGEAKAYGYFMRNYGLTREQIDLKLGIK